MRKKRRSRGHGRSERSNTRPNLIPVMLILCLSVCCGYATAKYVVAPAVNYAPQLLEEKENSAQETKEKTSETKETRDESKATKVVEDEVKVEETGQISGYAVQFGCYSTKGAAETAKTELGMEGLRIMEQNGMYKIVGEVFDTKEKAKNALRSLPDGSKAFVTTIYKQKTQ